MRLRLCREKPAARWGQSMGQSGSCHGSWHLPRSRPLAERLSLRVCPAHAQPISGDGEGPQPCLCWRPGHCGVERLGGGSRSPGWPSAEAVLCPGRCPCARITDQHHCPLLTMGVDCGRGPSGQLAPDGEQGVSGAGALGGMHAGPRERVSWLGACGAQGLSYKSSGWASVPTFHRGESRLRASVSVRSQRSHLEVRERAG